MLRAVSAAQAAKGEEFKAAGNTLFAANKYGKALDLYTQVRVLFCRNPVALLNDERSMAMRCDQAIECNPNNAVYWSNRAFCQIKLENYGRYALRTHIALTLTAFD